MSHDLQIWIDGELRPLAHASTGPLANGLHYGTGVFEGIRAYRTDAGARVFRLDAHLERMKRGADVLGMAFEPDRFAAGTLQTLAANNLLDAYIRPISYYEHGGIGLDTAPLRPRGMIATLPWTTHLGDAAVARGLKLHTTTWRRTPATSLPPLKLCGNYVNSIIAKREATLAGADEALFADASGFVCECTGENVFMVKAGRVTAVRHPDALSGITRATLIELLGCDDRAVTLDELRGADEIFVTGTSAEVTRIASLDGRDLGDSPATREIAALYQAVVHGKTELHRGWLFG